MRRVDMRLGAAVGALVALAGCGSSSDSGGAAAGGPSGVSDGLVWGDEGPLAAPPPGQGVQYSMVSTLEPGLEIERCMLVQVGAEGLTFDKTETRFTHGSHHVLLYETSYTTMPTATEDGLALDPTKVHDCPDGGAGTWDVTRVLGGSQNFEGASLVADFPAGVGVKVKPNTILLVNTHYLNTSSEPVKTEARVNVWTVDPATVTTEAGILFFYNPFIKVGASSTGSAEMRCPMGRDITLGNVQSHMHRRGVGYTAWLGDDSNPKAQQIYTNDRWEEVPIQTFPGGLAVHAGQTLDYVCHYKNSETRDVYQGLTTKDEMCMLVGPYWPRDTSLENCVDDAGDLAGTWVGAGSADGATTVQCILHALEADSRKELEHAYFGCITDACPGVQRQVSEFARCQLSQGHGSCRDVCDDVSSSDCTKCMTTECGPAGTSAATAKCE